MSFILLLHCRTILENGKPHVLVLDHHLPLTTIWLKLSSSGYIFLVASTIASCVFFSYFFGQVLYGEENCFFVIRLRANIATIESVVILEPHGIQLETHRGFLTRLPWLTSRRFIASTHLHGVYISEGLKGWNVRFYLVAIRHTALPGPTFGVAYQVSDFKSLFTLLGYSTRY